MTGGEWRKSSYSSNNGNCVEAAMLPGVVAVRDSKDPGPTLAFGPETWRAFVGALKSGSIRA